MKRTLFAVAALVTLLVACSAPKENVERSAACKEAGNTKMCSSCCKTQKSNFTSQGMTGTCQCLGDAEK